MSPTLMLASRSIAAVSSPALRVVPMPVVSSIRVALGAAEQQARHGGRAARRPQLAQQDLDVVEESAQARVRSSK